MDKSQVRDVRVWSKIGSEWPKMELIFKSPRFVTFRVNVTQFVVTLTVPHECDRYVSVFQIIIRLEMFGMEWSMEWKVNNVESLTFHKLELHVVQ